MSLYQRTKGRRVEQELVLWLREHGLDAQRYGLCGQRDVLTKSPSIAWESKAVARAQTVLDWLEQAERLAEDEQMAVVVVKPDRKRRIVVMDAERFVALLLELQRALYITPGLKEEVV